MSEKCDSYIKRWFENLSMPIKASFNLIYNVQRFLASKVSLGLLSGSNFDRGNKGCICSIRGFPDKTNYPHIMGLQYAWIYEHFIKTFLFPKMQILCSFQHLLQVLDTSKMFYCTNKTAWKGACDSLLQPVPGGCQHP